MSELLDCEILPLFDLKVTPIERGYQYRFLRVKRELDEKIAKAFRLPPHLLEPKRR